VTTCQQSAPNPVLITDQGLSDNSRQVVGIGALRLRTLRRPSDKRLGQRPLLYPRHACSALRSPRLLNGKFHWHVITFFWRVVAIGGSRSLESRVVAIPEKIYSLRPATTFSVMDTKESWKPGSAPESVARKNHDDGFWYVCVTWGNGRKNRQGPYKTEAIATERIKTLLDAWHEGRNLFRR
jgi:hypothetical protein